MKEVSCTGAGNFSRHAGTLLSLAPNPHQTLAEAPSPPESEKGASNKSFFATMRRYSLPALLQGRGMQRLHSKISIDMQFISSIL